MFKWWMTTQKVPDSIWMFHVCVCASHTTHRLLFLFAMYFSMQVDCPRNLAKSVTVEWRIHVPEWNTIAIFHNSQPRSRVALFLLYVVLSGGTVRAVLCYIVWVDRPNRNVRRGFTVVRPRPWSWATLWPGVRLNIRIFLLLLCASGTDKNSSEENLNLQPRRSSTSF